MSIKYLWVILFCFCYSFSLTDSTKAKPTETKKEPAEKSKEAALKKVDSAPAKDTVKSRETIPEPKPEDNIKDTTKPAEPVKKKAVKDSVKSQAVKDTTTVTSNQDSTKVEPAKVDSIKAEQVKFDTSKADTISVNKDSVKTDSVKSDSANIDSTKIDSAKTDSTLTDSSKMDTTKSDSMKVDSSTIDSSSTDTTKMDSSSLNQDSTQMDSAKTKKESIIKTKKKKKSKLYYSSRINTIDDMKGRYKSPKKALFMSLVLPGLGQAYVGNYIRGGAYIVIEGLLGYYWHFFVVTKFDRQVKKYQTWADSMWNHGTFEEDVATQLTGLTEQRQREIAFPNRKAYCDAVFGSTDSSSNTDGFVCLQMEDNSDNQKTYREFEIYRIAQGDTGSVENKTQHRLDNVKDLQQFYELIGKYDEFITGWDGAQIGTNYSFDSLYSEFKDNPISAREKYRDMRQKATDFSRMQSVFLGGIILNHIVSAIDAALSAKFHNKRLYQTDVKWYDRLKLESHVGLENGYLPYTYLKAKIPF